MVRIELDRRRGRVRFGIREEDEVLAFVGAGRVVGRPASRIHPTVRKPRRSAIGRHAREIPFRRYGNHLGVFPIPEFYYLYQDGILGRPRIHEKQSVQVRILVRFPFETIGIIPMIVREFCITVLIVTSFKAGFRNLV